MSNQQRDFNLLEKTSKRAVTLLEVITVLIIVGIVSSLGVINYTNVKEHALGKEAQSILRMVAAAERVYRLELGSYYNPLGATQSVIIGNVNNNLKLSVPIGSDWNYTFSGVTATTFTARATRNSGSTGCQYSIDQATVDNGTLPITAGTCP